MYTVKDASVAYSLMAQRFQPSNTSLLLDEYFNVCKLYGDTATARETHQRYVTQVESMRGLFTAQSLRNSEHEAFRDANASRHSGTAAAAKAKGEDDLLSPSNGGEPPGGGRRGRAAFSLFAPTASAESPKGAVGAGESDSAGQEAAPTDKQPTESGETGAFRGDGGAMTSTLADRAGPSPSAVEHRGVADARRVQVSLQASAANRQATAGGKGEAAGSSTANTAAEGNVRSAASYAILRREWGHENYEEQFHKPWNAFQQELSGVMMEVVTAWVSDLDECTPYSQHLIRRSSTCCYDAAHGMCLLRWNTMREVRAYVDALHAVVNAPLSAFFVPLTLGMQVLGVPVLCMSLAPVTGPWQGWDAVTVVWHSFCGLCANLRLTRPLDRAEGGRSEVANSALLTRITAGTLTPDTTAAAAAPAGTTATPWPPHTASASGGAPGNVLERSVAWSLLRQIEGGGGGGGAGGGGSDYYGNGSGASPVTVSGNDLSPHNTASATSGMWEGRRNSVFRGEPTTLVNSAAGMVGRVSRQVFAAAAAGQWGPSARSGGLQLTPAIGADARWYFVDARALCLYQWYARSSWVAARVPRREMFHSENGCVQRGVGPNKLILQSKLRIMVGQLLNGLLRFNSSGGAGNGSGVPVSPGIPGGILQAGSMSSPTANAQRSWQRGKPPILLSTLCHSHGVRYGTYVYAIVDLLRTEEESLDEAVQTALRLGSSSPNKFELLKQCRRCIQAVVGELLARAIKHLIHQEWYMVVRQSPDWLHRFHTLCASVAEADELAVTLASAAASGAAAAASGREGGGGGGGDSELFYTTTPLDRPSAAEDPFLSTQTEGQQGAAAAVNVADGLPCDEESEVLGSVSDAVRHQRLLAFIDETREGLGAPLLDAVRRVLNGVFIVNMSAPSNGSGLTTAFETNVSSMESAGIAASESAAPFSSSGGGGVAGNALEQASTAPPTPHLSTASGTASGPGVSIGDSLNRYSTDEAGRSLATSSAQALGGYPVFNPQLSAVTFRPTMFEELLLAVNDQYVVRPYSGNEKMSEWQLLHKRAPVVTRRGLHARPPPSVSSIGVSGGGANGAGSGAGGAGVGSGAGNSGANASNSGSGGTGESWLGRGANRSSLGPTSASAPSSPATKRGRSPSRLRGAIPVYYPAADEESIQVEAKDLFPGWSLQCLEEMLGVPLVLRQNRVDVDGSFTGAHALRAVSPSLLTPATTAAIPTATGGTSSSASDGGRVRRVGAALAARAPLSAGCPLRSAVWGTPLELPLCLHSGSVEGALEYAQHQREIGIAIVSSGLSSPYLGHGRGGAGASAALWRGRNPHLVYMGKLIQLHAADVRIACRGWAIMEDFDFLKQSDQPNERMLGGAAAGRLPWSRRRAFDSPLAQRQHLARVRNSSAAMAINGVGALNGGSSGGGGGGGGGELALVGASGEDALTAMAFSAAMHVRLSLLNARVDLHEAMSSMWHLTECMESMNGSQVVYGYLLRQKVNIITTVATQFTASGVTTALEAAIADLDVLTGGIFNFSTLEGVGERYSNSGSYLRSVRVDEAATTAGESRRARGMTRMPSRSPPRAAFSPLVAGGGERRSRAAPVPLSPSHDGLTDALAHFPATPVGSQVPTFGPAQRTPAVTEGTAASSIMAVPTTPITATTPTLSVDRLRSVPLPAPITQRQVAVVAAAARRANARGAEVPNPLSVHNPLLESAGDSADTHLGITSRMWGVHGGGGGGGGGSLAPLVSSIGAFKSFILRSVQCVDLYNTLLELLTRHMLLPDAHRTPKESLSRAVMFCSLRRELIVMTHGENSVEAAMAAGDVGLLLLQNPKTWPQAKMEFYRARRSIIYHLRAYVDGTSGGANVRGRGKEGGASRQLTTGTAFPGSPAFEASLLAPQSSSSVFVQDGRGGVATTVADRVRGLQLSSLPSPTPRAYQQPHNHHHVDSQDRRDSASLLEDASNFIPSSPNANSGGGRRRRSWMVVRGEPWTTAPDRLKQALCSVLNNIAFLFCRQAQAQYAVHQESMAAFVRHARRQNTLHRVATGLQLHERRLRRAAKVEAFLQEASTTLQGVLQHASDVPVYDYAVALNNKACVLLHRYQYDAARLLLLQSLHITLQLQSLSVAPVALPACLVDGSASRSVLWLLDPSQLQTPTARAAAAAAAGAAPTATRERVRVLGATDGVRSDEASQGSGASTRRGSAAVDGAAYAVTAATTHGSARAEERKAVSRRQASRTATAPNTLTTITAMLRDLGATVDGGEAEVRDYYYTTGATSPRFFSAVHPNTVAAQSSGAAPVTTSAALLGASSPIAASERDQVRNCQVHTLRMLYQLEVQKSFLDRLRIQQLFGRYLTAWRERRQRRRAQAAAELYRFGAAAMTRVYLARRYRFSGYHWWLRQPRAVRRHLDSQINPAALTTRRQLWDVWNAQVETAARVLQRVLRGAAVRKTLAEQHEFRTFYFQRCRPAVEGAVWQKMNLLYTSVLLHQHVQEGLRGMAAFTEAVQSGAMWRARVAKPLMVQQEVSRIAIQLKELQRRETLERDFYRVHARQRLSQMEAAQMKASVLLAIRSPRPSLSPTTRVEPPFSPSYQHQPYPPQSGEMVISTLLPLPPLPLSPAPQHGRGSSLSFYSVPPPPPPAAAVPAPRDMDMAAAVDVSAASEGLSRAPHTSVTSPPSTSDMQQLRGATPLALDYTPPAAFASAAAAGLFRPVPPPTTAAAASPSAGRPPRLVLPSSPSDDCTPQSPPVSSNSPGNSRTRRVRQVVIQADAADLDVDLVTPAARSPTTGNEERYRQMQRQYRDDERAKMSQLRLQHEEAAHAEDAEREAHEEGGGGVSGGDGVRRRDRKGERMRSGSASTSSGGHSPVAVSTEDANAKWRHAVQRVGEPRTTLRSDGLPDRQACSPTALIPAWPSVNQDTERRSYTPSPHTSSSSPPFSPGGHTTELDLPLRQARRTLPPPDSVVRVLPAGASPPRATSPVTSSSAVSTASSRVAVAAAEVQRHQLQHASQLLLQFWWSKRALPTFVASSTAVHRTFAEHCCAVHALWLRETAVSLQLQRLAGAEAEGRGALLKAEAVGRASVLLLQAHNMRCVRESDAHARWLTVTVWSEERRGRAALLLAAVARDRHSQPTL